MKHRQRVVGIYCMVPSYIAAVLPASAAFTSLFVHRTYRWNGQYSHMLSSEVYTTSTTHPHKQNCQRRWEVCAVNDDSEVSHNNRNSILQNTTTTLTPAVSQKNIDNTNTEFDWDTFLDTPFFDPNTILNDPSSNSLLKRFATWVQEDYETVEVIVTGTLFIFLIVVTQELLRIQIYGFENYVPFTKGIPPGSLF
jgi:hypothetical protein